MVQQKNNILCC